MVRDAAVSCAAPGILVIFSLFLTRPPTQPELRKEMPSLHCHPGSMWTCQSRKHGCSLRIFTRLWRGRFQQLLNFFQKWLRTKLLPPYLHLLPNANQAITVHDVDGGPRLHGYDGCKSPSYRAPLKGELWTDESLHVNYFKYSPLYFL